MKTIGNMRNLFLLLALIVAGVQSAWAFDYKGKVEYDKAEYYIYSSKSLMGDDFYSASLANITGTGDVVIPSSFEYTNWDNGLFHYYGKAYVGAAGWWYDQQKAEDITCSADITSLLFEGAIEIHGHFTLQNLYGSLSFSPLWSHSTILSDATLDIPHVNVLNCYSLQVDGTILAPALQKLTLQSSTTVNGTITAANATQAIIGGTVNASGKVNAPAATQLDISQGAKVYGTINAMATKVNIASGTQVTGLLYVPVATNIVMDANSFDGTISSNSLTSITLRQTNFGTSGKLQSSNLRDIYIPSKTALPTFYGTYSDHFTAPSGSITVHVYDMTANEIAAMKNSMVWNGFKEIVNHKSEVSYTLINNSMATVSFLGKDGGYDAPTNESQYAQVISGSKTGTVKAERDYSVEIRDIDFDTKTVTLKRNGQSVALKSSVNQGLPVRYYDDLDLQQDVRYEVSVSDLKCDIDFAQQVYTGRIMYQKTLNGSNSTGVISSQTARVTCTRGSRLKLTIPYDPTSYTPNKLYLGGSEVTMTKANGEATATITVPASASAEVLLTWQAPQQTFTHHQPEIMIMRSGEGDILFKGLCAPEEQAQEAYEQQFGYPAENGVVVSAVSNCTNTVTTVTVPDYDYLGRGADYTFDAMEWGFRAEITPVAGQTLKTLLVGYIDEEDDRETIIWEDMLYGENYGMYAHPEYNYVTYNESTNTYTFNWGLDEMNVWIGDYVVNIGLGPEETTVETGATLNFVRQGGRTEVLFEKEDVDGTLTDQVIGEGSMSFNLKYFTEAELEDAAMNYYQLLWFNPVEGETIHVFCDGTDITSQLIYNSETGNARLELERKNHTYTLLIDDAPDANPTWSIHNATEADVIVERTLKNGTTETTTYAGNLNDLVIDDTQVNMVTLKVYVENQDESKPVRILMNGVDVSYQFNTMSNDGDGLRLHYEVPVNMLTDCTWNISYDTDHKQTYIVRGGTKDPAVEIDHEYLGNGPIRSLTKNNSPSSIYFAPFNSDYNSYIYTTIYVNDGETPTILRNGVPVTNLFDERTMPSGERYFILEVNDADFEGDNTLSAFGFDIREAAVWEITIEEPLKMLNAYANNDVIVSIAKLVDGEQPTFAGRENAIHRWINVGETCEVRFVPQHNENLTRFDIGWNSIDIENESRLVKNDDGSYSFTITYDEINEKTFDILAVFSGGTNDDNAVEYLFIGDFNQVYASADLNDEVQYNGYEFFKQDVSEFYIDKVVENEMAANQSATLEFELPNANATGRVFRNGVDLTDQFVNNNGNYYPKEELRSLLHEPAHWVIINESDLMKYDVNRDNKVDISDVTKLVNKVLNK